MADTSASASSSPSATASSVKNHYHVFINHRGADVKKTFASHLYRHLFSGHGLRVFLDKHELKVGEHFPSEIKDVIRTASVHVAIFSPGYAESEWCLRELLLMLESNAPIIPVFYHVEPADLRWTQSEQRIYSKGLRKLESRHDSITIQKWRDALSLVADKSGLDLKETCNGDEGELVEKIAQWVLKKVKRPGLILTTIYPIGLNEKVESFENKVLKNQQSGKALVVGIVGMGGAGKTTLAVELFNRKSSNYDKSYFLHVRAGKSSLPSLQTKLLKGLFQLDRPVDNIHEGMGTLTEFLSTSHSKLIVLDNVDDKGQVKALLPDVKSVISSSTSFVLITCRDIDVLRGSGVEESSIYHLDGLNPQYSLQLFCLHAFSQPHPPLEFKDRVDKFLEVCDGLPLSLEVFGALLHDVKDMSLWDAHLDRLRKTLPSDIKERLQISYEALSPEDKEIFLDIACFFIGENRDMAIRIWDGSDWQGSLGFRNLQNRCLVQVDSENRIKMHDHLIDLGRANAEKSGNGEKSASRHCLWPPTENIHDLLQKTSIRDEVRGIRMRPSDCNDNADLTLPSEFIDCDDEYRSFSRYKMKKLQLLDIEGGLLDRVLKRVHAPDLIWLRWIKYPRPSLPSWIPMKKLRVLEVQGNELETLWESESQAPLELRELKIRDAPLSKFPESIGKLKHLQQIYVNLRKGGINVETLPEEFCNLQSLMTLELLNCCEMKSLPELFGNLTNLEHIDVTGCCKLERLPNSFGNLIRLKYLKLSKCSKLTISSETLGNILTLEYINLSFCSKIKEMPPQIALQRSLGKLYCMDTAFTELPRAIGNLTELEVLYLGDYSLKALPHSLGDLRNLKQLTLRCQITELPFKARVDSSSDNCMFPRLQYIFLEVVIISELSFDEGVCPNLQYLMVHNCTLIKVGTLPNTLKKLELYQCKLSMSIDLRGLAKLEMLHINDCIGPKSIWGLEELTKLRVVEILSRSNRLGNILELPSFKDLRLLERFRARSCDFRSIKGLEQLTKLRELDLYACSNLEVLPGVEHLRSLEKLKASSCNSLRSIQVSEQLTKLRELDVSGCSNLEVLPGVEHLRSLEKLKASACNNLRSIQVSEKLTKLRELDVSGCSKLEVLPGVEHLRSLENLKASACDNLRSLQVSKQLTKLRELDVSGCSKLEVLPGVEHLRSLEKLKASSCDSLRSIQVSEQLTKLRELDVSGCSKLEVLPGVEHLRSLENLKASACDNLRSIQVSEQLTKLRKLDVSRCSKLEVLPGVEHLRSLVKLKASHCYRLKNQLGLEQLTQLRELDVSGCYKLKELKGVEQCIWLKRLNVSGCDTLQLSEEAEQLCQRLTELEEAEQLCQRLTELEEAEQLEAEQWRHRLTQLEEAEQLEAEQLRQRLTELEEAEQLEAEQLRQRLTELQEAEQLEAEQLRQRLTELQEAKQQYWNKRRKL